MATPRFIALERFDPSDGEKWHSYTQWANIPALEEVISLDTSLCPRIIREFGPDDWAQSMHADVAIDYFSNLEYLLQRVAGTPRKNILGLYRNPEAPIDQSPGAGEFVFVGYDLIEELTQISALTNCGGFPNSFSNSELNKYGLIETFDRAAELKIQLKVRNPEEAHANCELYAVWRMEVD